MLVSYTRKGLLLAYNYSLRKKTNHFERQQHNYQSTLYIETLHFVPSNLHRIMRRHFFSLRGPLLITSCDSFIDHGSALPGDSCVNWILRKSTSTNRIRRSGRQPRSLERFTKGRTFFSIDRVETALAFDFAAPFADGVRQDRVEALFSSPSVADDREKEESKDRLASCRRKMNVASSELFDLCNENLCART